MILYLKNGRKIEKGLFGWVSKIKDRMYRTITPRGYNIGQATKEFIKGDTRDMSKFSPLENEVWARYLGTKYKGPSNLEPAIYRPTKGEATYDDVVKLKDESLILSDDVLKLLLDNYKKTGKKSMLVKGNESGLGTYTVSMGEDKKGKYISYYDDWDINPTRGISAKYNIPILNLIGDIVPGTHPFSVYGRRYYKNGGQIRKMQTASGGPIYLLRKRLYNNIEPFGYNDVGSRLVNAVVLNKNEHNNFKGNYSDPEKAPALYLIIDNIWGEYLHIPEKERRYPNGKYKIKNNGNGTFSLPFESMEDIMQAVNSSNNPLLWGLRGKLGNSVIGEYDVYRGYDKNGDYLKYIDHWRINPYDVKKDKEYGLDNNSLLKWYFKGKDDASFGLGTPVEIQGKYYLDDIYNVKGNDRGGHYLPEVIVTGKLKQGGKMNAIEQFKNGSKIHIKKKNRGKFTAYCGGNVTSACIAKAKASGNPTLVKRATFADNARHFKHRSGGLIFQEFKLRKMLNNIINN